MSGEWTSLSVRENTRDRFNNAKQERQENSGAMSVSSDVFLNQLLECWENRDSDKFQRDSLGAESEPCPECGRERGTEDSCMACEIERIVEESSSGVDESVVATAITNDLQATLPQEIAEAVVKELQ